MDVSENKFLEMGLLVRGYMHFKIWKLPLHSPSLGYSSVACHRSVVRGALWQSPRTAACLREAAHWHFLSRQLFVHVKGSSGESIWEKLRVTEVANWGGFEKERKKAKWALWKKYKLKEYVFS